MQCYVRKGCADADGVEGGENRASEKQNPVAIQRGERGWKLSLPGRIRRPSADSRYLDSGISIGMQLNPW